MKKALTPKQRVEKVLQEYRRLLIGTKLLQDYTHLSMGGERHLEETMGYKSLINDINTLDELEDYGYDTGKGD